jgi:hypothetical protein
MDPFKVNYQKVRMPNLEVMTKQSESKQSDDDCEQPYDYNPFRISGLQSYNPLYNLFFNMDSSNCQKITLNHKYIATSLETVVDGKNAPMDASIFVKSSPLLDPLHFLRGKYDLEKPIMRQLPTLDSTPETCFPKLLDPNNSAYVDGFFSYLTSMMYENHGWIHGVQYYGSFLGVQSRFKYNVADDLEFLEDSEYFSKNISKYFDLDEDAAAIFKQKSGPGSRRNRDKLKIADDETIDLGIEDFAEGLSHLAEGCDISPLAEGCDISPLAEDNTPSVKGTDDTNVLTEAQVEYICDERRSRASSTSSSSSSNSSISNSSNESLQCTESLQCDVSLQCEECECVVSSPKHITTVDGKSYCGGCSPEGDKEEDKDSKDDVDEDSNYTDFTDDDEEKMFAYLHDFPVQLIFQEKCTGTFDELLVQHALSPDETIAALFQILIMLATYQKTFSFTHNDLHTNNIMFVKTDQKFIHYLFEGEYYRVPTHGRIFKLIDFGRAIYQFNGRRFCSDSFAENGDANSQYNCEPYFNTKKARIEPNPSFDISRLGCSLYDFTMESDSAALKNLIDEWCEDDYGKNILYKSSGEERYPGFKLYKMIARIVNNLVPKDIMRKPVFAKYRQSKAPKEPIINIDAIPSYITSI